MAKNLSVTSGRATIKMGKPTGQAGAKYPGPAKTQNVTPAQPIEMKMPKPTGQAGVSNPS